MRFGAKYKLVLILMMCCFGLSAAPAHKTDAFTNQVIQKGAVGDDVIELQSRLQYLGYYQGQIDGVFGWGTYWALRNFQESFGLKVDGLAGEATKAKLVKASKYNKQFVKEQIKKGKNSLITAEQNHQSRQVPLLLPKGRRQQRSIRQQGFHKMTYS